jgi:hypothetical protein
MGVAWGAFSAARRRLAATGRFMFPNVLNEPPQQFKAGFPTDTERALTSGGRKSSGSGSSDAERRRQRSSGGCLARHVHPSGCTPNT